MNHQWSEGKSSSVYSSYAIDVAGYSKGGSSNMMKVLLLNEQKLFNEALELLLSSEPDMHVVGAVADGQEAMKEIAEKQPDIILLDIHITSIDGIKLTVHIKDNYPKAKVIYLTNFSKKELVVAGVLAGADGFLLKDVDIDSLLQAIRNAYRGQVVISGEAAKILVQKILELKYDRHEILKKRLALKDIYLSIRELEISLLLIDQFTNKEISSKLYLSEGTIKNYISDLYSKLQVDTRKEAIDYLRNLSNLYYK